MKNKLIIFSVLLLFASCGKAKTAAQLGQEVCDCFQHANAVDPASPKRAEAQTDCSKKQMESWNKIKDNSKKAGEYNEVLSKCASEQIKGAFR